MEIVYKHGDVLEGDEPAILQGCNAQGAMNSGVAKAIRDLYPEVFTAYRAVYDARGLEMGSLIPVVVSNTRGILNGITQEFYGRDPNVRYVSYDAVADVIKEVNKLGFETVAMPLIGAGLGNGKWPVIEAIIEEYSEFIPVVYRF